MIQIDLMPDHSEIIHYEQNEIPLYIHTWNLSVYPGMSAPCHWHEDLEWIHILEGKMCSYVNGRRMVLQEKESLFINARQMHYGYAFQKQDCRFSCILFHPSLFCSNPYLQNQYVLPAVKNESLEYLHFSASGRQEQEVATDLLQITTLKEHAPAGYEWEAVAQMHLLWGKLWRTGMLTPAPDRQTATQGDLAIQKDMVSYLYQHYSEKVTLNDLAAFAHISRSKCCRIFKHYLQQSPIDFLNAYRLKVSCSLLASTNKTITEIAFACGFNHLSYYSKYFAESYGCTPREYRKRNTACRNT